MTTEQTWLAITVAALVITQICSSYLAWRASETTARNDAIIRELTDKHTELSARLFSLESESKARRDRSDTMPT